jgi:hypothetical protein
MFVFTLCAAFGLTLYFSLIRPVLHRAGWI